MSSQEITFSKATSQSSDLNSGRSTKRPTLAPNIPRTDGQENKQWIVNLRRRLSATSPNLATTISQLTDNEEEKEAGTSTEIRDKSNNPDHDLRRPANDKESLRQQVRLQVYRN